MHSFMSLKILTSMDPIHVLSNPHRQMILQMLMTKPMTVSQLGRELSEYPAGIRYHVMQLEKVGLVVLATGVLYMVFIGRHLLPVRQSPVDAQVKETLRKFISSVRVLPDGKLVNSTLLESKLGEDYDLTAIAIMRDSHTITELKRDSLIQTNDILLIEGSNEDLTRAMRELGLETADGSTQYAELNKLGENEIGIVEVTLAP